MPTRAPTHRPKHAVAARKATAAAHDRFRGSAASRGYDSRWEKVRQMKVALDPLCEDCFSHGYTQPASEVHHIVSIKEDATLRLELTNLMSLCHKCHRRIEASA